MDMKKTKTFLGILAFMLTLASNPLSGQGLVQLEFFYGTPHPWRQIVTLQWRLVEDPEMTLIIIEHSIDNVSFESVGEIQPIYTGAHGQDYRFLHPSTTPGLNYYRLRFEFHNGDIAYSHPIKMLIQGAPPILVYHGAAPANLTGEDGDTWVDAMITDLSGRPVMVINQSGETNLENLPPGIYVVRARTAKGWVASLLVR
jgi:hypothetical protein